MRIASRRIIPSYRLPRNIVEAEIEMIRNMGVTMKTGVEVGKHRTVAKLRQDGFKAFFIAIGAQESVRLGVPGEDLDGVYQGLDYLRQLSLGKPIKLGERVAVIGGGNVAMDAVRSARRLGSEKAFILYRRGFGGNAFHTGRDQAVSGRKIPIKTLAQPVRFISNNGRVKAIECVKMRLTEPDESGRRKPEPISVRGAFTHAIRDKKGLIEAADKGTLFLDEIGNISPEMQVRLLRFLEDRKIRRIGDLREIPVDCRVISATNVDLPEEVASGGFREDLYYRLRVVTLKIPPLRDRREDIPVLAVHFVETFCAAHGLPSVKLPPETLKWLTEYPWPGNVRELKNALEAGVVLCRDGVLYPSDMHLSGLPQIHAKSSTHRDSSLSLEDAVFLQGKTVRMGPPVRILSDEVPYTVRPHEAKGKYPLWHKQNLAVSNLGNDTMLLAVSYNTIRP